MMLVADSGSTKTDWGLMGNQRAPIYFTTSGYNPFFIDAHSLPDRIAREIRGYLDLPAIRHVYFYGAGCQGSQVKVMEGVLQRVFTAAEHVQVEVDLLAAARALLGEATGFAAILGTGTNTCLYDGWKIAHHIDSLGFLLGDEGSGAAIGKRILTDFLRNQMDEPTRDAFKRMYGRDEDRVMQQLYGSNQPNRYCASFAKFLDDPAVSAGYRGAVVEEAFRAFFERLVCLYPDYQSLTFNCVGSVGYHFRDLLGKEAERHGMSVGIMLSGVIERLTLYHRKKLNNNSL